MVIRLRTAFFIFLVGAIVWFLYVERAILTPFILGAIFAYLFNPVVSFFEHKIKIPRTITVFIIYAVIMFLIIALGILLTRRLLAESFELGSFIRITLNTAKEQINNLPDFIRPTVIDTLISLEKSKLFSTSSLFFLFPQAISRIVSFFIFLVSGFYFLKEGRTIFDRLLLFVPQDYRLDLEILFRKINAVLSSYLREQLFLVLFVSVALFVALSIFGVRFALIMAIFSGFAEIVPLIGPIVAGAVAMLVVFVTGNNNFSLQPSTAALVVAAIYFVVRQFQDYFVTPHVMGKIAKLHPIVILFAVLAGEHTAGILGLILAVPIAAILKIFLEFFLEKVNNRAAIKKS